MALTPQQVAEKKFTSTRFKNGYDETEVDAFLDEVEAELTKLHEESATLRRQLEGAQLSQAVTPDLPAPQLGAASVAAVISGESKASQGELEEMLRRTLLLAQRTADEVVAEAKADAERRVSSARAEADALRSDGEQHAADAERAATMRATVSIAEFEAGKRRLEEQITSLHTFEAEFRGRLRAYLELQLNDLDGARLVPPGEPSADASVASPPPAEPLEEPEPPAAVHSGSVPAVLPELPPLPSWMHADAGFATDDSPVAPAQPPEGAG